LKKISLESSNQWRKDKLIEVHIETIETVMLGVDMRVDTGGDQVG
jgi:hypothetical protein